MQVLLIFYLATRILFGAAQTPTADLSAQYIAGADAGAAAALDPSALASILDQIATAAPGPDPAPASSAPAAAAPSPAPATPPANITYQPARCGPWFGGQACPPDAQNRQLYCSQWGYCGWEFQPQELAGRFLHPDLACTADADCAAAVANSGLKSVVCSPAEHKCLVSIGSATATAAAAAAPTTSAAAGKLPAVFAIGLMVASAVLI